MALHSGYPVTYPVVDILHDRIEPDFSSAWVDLEFSPIKYFHSANMVVIASGVPRQFPRQGAHDSACKKCSCISISAINVVCLGLCNISFGLRFSSESLEKHKQPVQ